MASKIHQWRDANDSQWTIHQDGTLWCEGTAMRGIHPIAAREFIRLARVAEAAAQTDAELGEALAAIDADGTD